MQDIYPRSPADRAGLRAGEPLIEAQCQQCWKAHSLSVEGVVHEVSRMLCRTSAYARVPGPRCADTTGAPGVTTPGNPDPWGSWTGVNTPQKARPATPPPGNTTRDVPVKAPPSGPTWKPKATTPPPPISIGGQLDAGTEWCHRRIRHDPLGRLHPRRRRVLDVTLHSPDSNFKALRPITILQTNVQAPSRVVFGMLQNCDGRPCPDGVPDTAMMGSTRVSSVRGSGFGFSGREEHRVERTGLCSPGGLRESV